MRNTVHAPWALALVLSSCNGSETPTEPGSGGSTVASGGAGVGGSGRGGSIGVGGYGTGGKATGGAAIGGNATGGNPTGGASTGGTATGGRATGGNASGGRGTGGSSGACAYDPCPTNGDACKSLPLGASITWGIGYDGAYRVELFSKAIGAQKKITFTGSLSNGPSTVAGQPFP